jgi:tetratricopeptide (TPR) repeat protein
VPTIIGIIIIVVVLYLYVRNKSQSRYITIALIVVSFILITSDNWEYITYDFSEHKLTLKAKNRDKILTNLVKNKSIIDGAATDTTTATSKSAPTIPEKTLGDLTVFIDLLTQTKTEKQFSFDDWYYKGAGEFANRNYPEAIISFKKALPNAPDDASASYTHNYIGASYGRLGRFKEALENYNESIKFEPNNPLPYTNKAYIYLILKKKEEAEKEINMVKELIKKESVSLETKAFIEKQIELREKELKELEDAKK